MSEVKNQCPEIPYFGSSYPDATCIDGELWDLDKFENGQLYGGPEAHCPFCNTEAFIKDNVSEGITRSTVVTWIEKMRNRWESKPKEEKK